jgi:membrane protease YdiL (CAAX protease family)
MEIFAALVVIALTIACPLAAGIIGREKGRSAFAWALLGFFLGVIGVVIAVLVPPRQPEWGARS